MSTLLLGVDIGTSSCKTALFDPDGKIVAQGGCEYPVSYPRKGWAEQDPAAWWDGVCRAVREMTAGNGINPAEIAGIGVDGQSWSAIALDAAGEVVGRYGLFDLGSGSVDEITMEKTVELGITSFLYYYDVTNRKSVVIQFEGEVADDSVKTGFPVIAESKGPNPIEFENGYVAFEDLPDERRHLPGENSILGGFDLGDDDEEFDDDAPDEDEEEDDDEDGKEIYDESEGI